MLDLVVMVAWVVTGVGFAAALTPSGESRWSSMPLAAIFGPLWVSIALDRRGGSRTN